MSSGFASAQSTIDPLDWYKGVSKDSIKRYKIHYFAGDSSYVDTTLNIKKYFKHNVLRKDDFKVLKFANQGENFNPLSYSKELRVIPRTGFATKQYFYLEKEDIKYFDVATPITELAYRNGYYRGQFLDALFAVNVLSNLNVSMGYMGLRSVGEYQRSLTSHGHMQATVNFYTKNKRYYLKAHYTSQYFKGQESGGLESDSLFVYNDLDYKKRSAFSMNLTNALTLYNGKRYYLDHQYNLPYTIGSYNGNVYLQHVSESEIIFNNYTDKVSQNKYYYASEVFDNKETNDSVYEHKYQNDIYLGIKGSENRSFLKVGFGHNYYNYQYDSIQVMDDNKLIHNYVNGSTVSAKAAVRLFLTENMNVSGDASYNVIGKFNNAFLLNGKINYTYNKVHNIGALVQMSTFYSDMQYKLFQSNYKQYNWFNNLKKENRLLVGAYFSSPKWFDFKARYILHNNYTYFNETVAKVTLPDGVFLPENGVVPVETVQYSKLVNIAELEIHKDFSFGKFGFDTRTLYQKVLSGAEVVKVPELITRNYIYYKDDWFRHAMEVNIGVGVKYFTEFSSLRYHPLLSSYYVTNNDYKIGNYPSFNFMFNARVRTMRIFLELENFAEPLLEQKTYFSAPHYPGADFTFRIGIVWNFFT